MLTLLFLASFLSRAALGDVSVGKQGPAFSLKTPSGQVFNSREELDGQVTIITFWRLEQAYSMKILTDLQTLYKDFTSSGIRVVAICSGTSKTRAVGKVYKDLKLSYPLLMDPDRSAYAAYGVFVSPATLILDKEGTVRFYRPSYNLDFVEETRLDLEFLLGKVSAQQHAKGLGGGKARVSRAMDTVDAQYKLALQLLKHGNREEARNELRKAWEGELKPLEAGLELGYVLLEDEEPEEALKVFSEASALAPKSARAEGGKAIALIKSGKKKEGKSLLEDVLGRSSPKPIFYYEMGRLLEEEGDRNGALARYKQGLEVAMTNR